MEILNFARKGNDPVVRVVTAAIPFLNARFQGLDLFSRAAQGKYSSNKDMSQSSRVQTVFFRGALLASLTSMYFLMVSDDDQYKNADEHTRDYNWLIPMPWGKPFKIPIPFEVGLLFKTLPEKMLAVATGESTGREAKSTAIVAATGTLGINPFGMQFIKPLVEVYFNYNFFTGNPIVSKYIDGDIQTEYVDRETTNKAAVEIAQVIGVSPTKLEHVMKGYSGTMGTYLMDFVDAIMRSPALSGNTGIEMPTRPISDYPLIRRFVAKNNNAGLKEDFYELQSETRKVTKTLNWLKGRGRIDEYKRYLEGREVLASMRDNVNYVADQLKHIRNQRDKIIMSDLSGDTKRELLDELIEEEKHVLRVTSVLKRKADLPVFDTLYR